MPSLLPKVSTGVAPITTPYASPAKSTLPPPLSPLQVYIPSPQDLTLAQMDAIWGDSGTMRYSGFFYEEPNQLMRDWERIETIEQMRRMDGACKAALTAIKAPIMAVTWRVEGEDEKINAWVSDMLFDQLRRPWKDFVHESLNFFDFGFSIFEKIYEKRGNYIALADMEPRIQHSILRFRMSTGAPGITQVIKTDEFPRAYAEVPAEKLLILTNEKEGDDITGQSVLRAAYKHYHFKDLFYKIQGIAAERHGVGTPVVHMPDGYAKKDKAAIEEMLTNYRSNQKQYILLPSKEWEIEILTPKTNSHGNAIEDAIAHHNNMILLTVLATFLNLGGDGTGSFALSKDLSSFFLKTVEQKLEYWKSQFERQVIMPLVKMNFGKNAKIPKLKYTPLGDINFSEYATTLTQLNSAGLLMIDGKFKKWAAETFQLPEITDDDVKNIDNATKEAANNVETDSQPSDDEQALLKPASPASNAGPSNPGALPANKPPMKAKNATEHGQQDPDIKSVNREARMEEMLEERPFKLTREMTLQEKRSNFQWLNDQFNKLQTRFSADLTQIGKEMAVTIAQQATLHLKGGNFAAIGTAATTYSPLVKTLIATTLAAAFAAGSSLAVQELKNGGIADAAEPVLDQEALAIREAVATQITKDFVGQIESTARSTALAAVQANVSPAATISKISQDVQTVAAKMTQNLTGSIIGQQVNNGRKKVFDNHAAEIGQYLRSEIIDDKTCPFCLTIDTRVVTADDPIASLDVFHNWCRGIWIPILAKDDQLPLNPIPKSVLDNIDTVEGKPFINGFTNIKKPIPASMAAKAQTKANEKK